jgi:cation diffusion facilitator CzcD-associated flavoprotein CzcO
MDQTANGRVEVVIVGSGFSGLCMAIKLKEAGVDDFVVLEKEYDVGGTWRDNTYPGAACDVPSVLYSYSFRQNPEWTRHFPSWSELLAYLKGIVDEYGLGRHLRFGVEVDEMRFDEAAGVWSVTTTGGDVIEARSVVSATGVLSKPVVPAIPGIESFEGTQFHSARWDHDHDMAGRRVAVIGTGASAIQFVPRLAEVADELHVFQRSPQWISARGDGPVSRRRRALYRRFPFLQRLLRWRTYWQFESLSRGFHGNPGVVDKYRKRAVDFISTAVEAGELRDVLTPDYTPGCRRRLISDDWYPALQRPNVELVTTGVSHVTRDSVVSPDGSERKVDTIIFGTGFAATDFLAPMKVFGLRGREISDVWASGAATKLGISTNGFPNFFIMCGPNTALGHNSIVFMIEAQARYIVQALQYVAAAKGAIDLRLDVQRTAYDRTQSKMKKTVWVSGCKSWYMSPDGRIDTLWPGTTISYWLQTRWFRARDYLVVPAHAALPMGSSAALAEYAMER